MADFPERALPKGAFSTSQSLRARAPKRLTLDDLSLQDVNEIRLLLRGESVIDWHRLDFETVDEARRLLALNALDPDDPQDVAHVRRLQSEAVQYITEKLKLRIDDRISSATTEELLVIASGRGRGQRQACTLLKVMHILHHLDARELRTMLAIPDSELFSLVEESVVRMFDDLRSANVPVIEFAWSRKTRSSLITKMLVKPETSAARVFDRLRFRLVVAQREDLEPTLHVMLHRCIPFNYVVPRQTVNSLLGLDRLERLERGPSRASTAGLDVRNEFSGQQFRTLNFVADLPVRVDDLLWDDSDLRERRGRVVFVLAEFQIIDEATAKQNEQGDAAHSMYKLRQHQRVKERLLHVPPGVPRESELPEK